MILKNDLTHRVMIKEVIDLMNDNRGIKKLQSLQQLKQKHVVIWCKYMIMEWKNLSLCKG